MIENKEETTREKILRELGDLDLRVKQTIEDLNTSRDSAATYHQLCVNILGVEAMLELVSEHSMTEFNRFMLKVK